MSHASGMAAAIRSAVESETFDLAGQAPATITNTIRDAFREPLPIDDMIRITFVTGAGKLGRQKYDDGAAKAVTSALIACGFEEDRGASAVRECAGSYKMQHDTGKNLKTVVVFPKIHDVAAVGESGDAGNGGLSSGSSLLQSGSPEEMIALSPMKVFDDLVKKRCTSWSQKKGCNAAITNIQKIVTEIEQRLLQGTPLNDQEQELYDAVSLDSLEAKHNKVRDMMHEQVESGNITDREKQQLLSQVTERMENVSGELATAEAENKPKKAEKLRQTKAKLETRKDMLSKISPLAPEPLKYQSEIADLQNELAPLLKLEESTKGRLLSVKETQHLARKDEILDEIAQYEYGSRGWFEDDDAFAARLEAARKVAKPRGGKSKASSSKGKPSNTSTMKPKSATNAWVSTSAPRAKANKTMAASKPKTKSANVGGVFAAMMLDSDSD